MFISYLCHLFSIPLDLYYELIVKERHNKECEGKNTTTENVTVFVCATVYDRDAGCCMRVMATHVTSGGMIIHQDYTLINLKH